MRTMTCNTQRLRLAIAATLLMGIVSSAVHGAETNAVEVTISTDFPGGNIEVLAHREGDVHLAPDLRGDSPWFYWYFEATARKAGRVRFALPDKVAGFANGGIGKQGPAKSTDLGQTWQWMGTDHVEGPAFFYDFSKPGERVRFAVTIPYLERELAAFLAEYAGNQHLEKSVLTKSRQGRDVELLRIGEPGPGKHAVLVTGRHHAAETMASFVLEGFLRAALADTPAADAFRRQYVLYAVPFVDKDGVELGDQGKNRKPHDHNRDYGEVSIYPEVQAIKELDRRTNFVFALDFHCPTLVMPDHQVMYFVGAKDHPPHNLENVTEFARWIKQGLPKEAPVGPLVWLRDEDKSSPKNSRYFGFKEGAIMAATLEFPFAPPGKATDVASCRRYGEIILHAWVETHFRTGDSQ